MLRALASSHLMSNTLRVLVLVVSAGVLVDGNSGRGGVLCDDAAILLQTHVESPEEAGVQGEEHPERKPQAMWEALESEPKASSGSFRQTLVNYGDAQYIAFLELGRQMITGILDTGSFELVVFGADCRSCGVAAHFNHHLSRTYTESALSVEQYYGSGRAISNAAHERLAIGPFRVANQSFWNVKYAQMPVLYGAAFEAIFGLGPPDTPMMNAWAGAEAAVARVLSYYDGGMPAPEDIISTARRSIQMAADATSAAPPLRNMQCTRFSICLGAQPASDGVLIWNDTEPERQSELFSRVPVIGNHSWSVWLGNATLAFHTEHASEALACKEGCEALIDSGTSILSAPSAVVQGLRKAVQQLDANCSNLDALPNLDFDLGGVHLSLPPDSYVASVVGDNLQHLQDTSEGHFHSDPHLRCQLLIHETNVNSTAGPLWILGMPFFRRYYTSFDLGNTLAERAIYVAPHTQDDCAPSTAEKVAATHSHQLRIVSLSRIRLPRTEQAVPLSG